jgi:CRISPR system Cascade subunit CasA
MSRFNLIDEKWIPVRFLDGTRDELGIRDTLLRAEEIATIEDPSPLVVAALHRFLLAVLYRALEGPTDIDQAKALFKEGLPSEKVMAYLEKWRDRFWLFDEKHPFYQVPAYEPQEKNGKKEWRSWPAIAAEHNANNAKVLFDHVEISTAGSIPSRKASQWLIACQTFALGGGNSDFVYTKGAPSANAFMVLPLGIHLHDTLLFSLVPENKEVLATDRPVWEQEPLALASLKNGIARPVMGVSDLFTWLARSIKFRLDGDGETLSELVFASGVECSSEGFVDPMLAYRIDDKKGKQPRQFRERGLWRDFDSLLPDNSHLAPKVIDHTKALARSNRERFPRSVMVLGQANSKAKIEYWRMERLALPESLAGDPFIREEIRQLLTEAEEAERAMEKSLKATAKLIIAKGDRDLQMDKWSSGKWIPGDVSKFIGKSTFEAVPVALGSYWSTLEARFHEILREYTLEGDFDDIRCHWFKSVRDTLIKAWEQHCSSVSMGDAWAIRALVKSERPVLRKIKELNQEILKLQPQEDSA